MQKLCREAARLWRSQWLPDKSPSAAKAPGKCFVRRCPHGDRRLRTAGMDVSWRGLVLALDVLGMELKTQKQTDLWLRHSVFDPTLEKGPLLSARWMVDSGTWETNRKLRNVLSAPSPACHAPRSIVQYADVIGGVPVVRG